MRRRVGATALVAVALASAGLAGPASASVHHYDHHHAVTGNVRLTLNQVRRVERITHRLPECKAHTDHWYSDCREFVGHRHTLASFGADGHTYYVGLVKGQLRHVEVYP